MKHEMFKVVGFVEKESVKDERKLWGQVKYTYG